MAQDKPKFTITISHNGVDEPIEANRNQALRAVLAHALQAFGLQGADDHALFNEANAELDLNRSVEDLGVASGTRLYLRRRAVRGG